MALGALLGWLLRSKSLGKLSKIIEYIILLLLFSLGIMVGANPHVMNNLDSIGLNAFIIAAGATMGSIVVAWALYHLIIKRR